MNLLRYVLPVLLSLLTPLFGFAGDLILTPAEVVSGGTVVLRWVGEASTFGVVRFDKRVIYLYPDRNGAIALMPVPLDMSSGNYPLRGAVVDDQGKTTPFELELRVRHKERPQESLTLPERMVSPRTPEDLARIERESRLLNRIFSGRSERSWDRFEMPVDAPISSAFGQRRLMNGQPRAPHSGTDFRSAAGTPVRAMSSGRVALDEELFYTGKTVVLDHGEGLFSLYAHLASISVKPGQKVEAGETIGRVGSSGRSTGPHLHLTVRLLGERVDPISFLDVLSKQDS
jgi:murein DD-endopeptidase MepM/ murein hydrolase activator NlpD